MIIRKAQAEELDKLSDLIMRSKALWGYDQEFMDACREELTLQENELETTELVVAESSDNSILGVAQIEVEGRIAELLKLFIEPDQVGTGVGKQLFHWCTARSAELGATNLTIEADPDAAAFYKRMGAVEVGRVASGSIEGRTLPKFVFEIR